MSAWCHEHPWMTFILAWWVLFFFACGLESLSKMFRRRKKSNHCAQRVEE